MLTGPSPHDTQRSMQNRLFDPANEWHDYKGCRLLRSRAIFAAKKNFLFVEHPHLQDIQLIAVDSIQPEGDRPDYCTHQDSAEHSNADSTMVAGYIILSTRTTLAVFRSILPGTTRFFFLPTPLLQMLRAQRINQRSTSWCDDALYAMHALIEAERVNKAPAGCIQHMSGYYAGLACLVLFDARGEALGANTFIYIILTACVSSLLLTLKYFPAIVHRPQQTVDALCDDVLCITAHASCVSMISDPILMHGCALHSACYVLEKRFKGRMSSLAAGTVVHTVLLLLLLGAYMYGMRIADTRRFMLSAVCPHALELMAQCLTHAHRVVMMTMADKF